MASELDVAAYLARVPASAKCKGMFFRDVIEGAREVSFDDTPELRRLLQTRYVAFKDYPLREHMELTAALAPRLYPDLPTREALRRFGWRAYPTFAASLAGRVVVGLIAGDVERLLDFAPRAIELSLSVGRVASRRLGERHYEIELRNVFGYVDCYYVGVFEGALLHHQRTPELRVRLESLSDATFDITWT
ncbi:MAG: DUF2378 family protein [Polyangiaceae bacterium]|nr:DUF2378 family protein [Polyangiaceae bacterium]